MENVVIKLKYDPNCNTRFAFYFTYIWKSKLGNKTGGNDQRNGLWGDYISAAASSGCFLHLRGIFNDINTCDSVLRREVNGSLECEIVNATVQYLMTVSSLSAGLYCPRLAIICGLAFPPACPL